ncbi:hypothetical protein NXH64_01110 [Butyrivibrio fibrisolvens]|uniref:hypothetical protein n=1 Tax=Pseudobutyrivibrio ruminis TaxID=46206 RepID=UPI000417DC10|nr:hypothetical protein [Pseudobutyrivibrio ruminis]MDC7278090.1 hypothetical protein [Butyrivibrio fibrisolvens]
MIEDIIKDVTYEYIQKSEIGEKLQPAFQSLQKAQEATIAYVNDDSSDTLKKIRIGTILTFSIISKCVSGKSVKQFDSKDWNDIAASVAEYAVIEGDERYSICIFSMYADYVDASANLLESSGIDTAKCDAIRALSERVRLLTDEFIQQNITEVDYTEQCLWILLEAMIKFLCTYTNLYISDDKAEFIENAAMFAFEYGRYTLYKQEQEILQLYLEHQCQLDNELEQKLSDYNKALKQKQEEFNRLIEDAYSPDIMNRLKSSVSVARNVGVDEEEILDSVDKVDDFFS